MILMDIFDSASLWTIVIAAHVVIGSAYFLWLRKKKPEGRLTNRQLLDWKPLPLVEEREGEVPFPDPHLMGKIDDKYLNVSATSFLCMDKEPLIMERSINSLHKYGVGSCGPRGFYGTIDVHLELEERLAKFLQVEETCVYSYGFSTVASAIPAYAKKGDIIFADESVWFAIQRGIDASRSTARYFKHNDMQDLERLLRDAAQNEEINPDRRAFLVAEAIYYNTGSICPLRKLVELARRYKLRIILDESLSIGVIGKHGRGLTEHLNVPRDEIDLIVGSLEHSFATIGGFCAGTHFIVEQQRLSGLGYCFSASLPPMLTEAAIAALDILEQRPAILSELERVSIKFHKKLQSLQHFKVGGEELSPVKHIYPNDIENLSYNSKMLFFEDMVTYCLQRGVALAMAAYVKNAELKCPEPSIRLASSRKLTDAQLTDICDMLDHAYVNCRKTE